MDFSYQYNVKVFFEKKHVGDIKEVENGFQYFPKGSKNGGEVFPTISMVKASIEAE